MKAELRARIELASALIFDCDGTLIDSAPVQVRAWTAGFRAGGHDMAEAWYRSNNGLSEGGLVDRFEQERDCILPRKQVIETMRRAYRENLEHLREIEAVSQIAREQFGVRPMAVATSGPAVSVLPSLAKLELDGLFDAIVTVDDVKRPKPFPDLFLEAAKRLGMAPENCLVFEDSPQGIASARAAGCEVIDIAVLIDGGERRRR
jgi:HAD superfamily hydrolase (TIGR01509 family)